MTMSQPMFDCQRVLTSIPVAIVICEACTARVIYANREAVELIGIDMSELQEMHLSDLLPALQMSLPGALLNGSGAADGPDSVVRLETSLRSGHGAIPVSLGLQLQAHDPEHPVLIAIARDRSTHVEELRQKRIAESVFEYANEAIVITDGDNRIIDVNPAFTRATGYRREEMIGNTTAALRSDRHPDAFYQSMWQQVRDNGFWRGELWNRHRNGDELPQLLSITRIDSVDEQRSHHVSIFTDISHLKAHEKKLRLAALYDDLTGLPNRRGLTDRLDLALARARRRGTSIAICFVDLDGFKDVNDRFGHRAGDRALKAIAENLRSCVREEDTVARLGGDEFVVLINDADDPSIYDRLIDKAAEPVSVGRNRVSLSASMGITLYPCDDSDSDGLLRHADIAMYTAKTEGKNRFRFFDPQVDKQRKAQRELVEALKHALDCGELHLWYQPQVDLISGEITGLEALVRWQHPERGLLEAADFLPSIFGTAFESPFGDWTLDQGIQSARIWWQQGYAIPVGINISPRHLLQSDFVPRLQELLERHQVTSPSLIALEIIENTAIFDQQGVRRTLDECRKIGIRVTLDDFGTGYASLKHLRSLPIDTLKIDQTFIQHMLEDKDDRTIVESTIFLAERFNLTVIAEGVESLPQIEKLKHMGCRQAQGFGIARPMPLQDVNHWLAQSCCMGGGA